MNVNDAVDCGAYGFNLGGWQGGQSDYLMVPYADWNLLPFPDKDQAMEKIRDLTLLSDILPTGFNGLMEAGAKVFFTRSSRARFVSATMMQDAPIRRAPAAAQRPTGPAPAI